MSSRWSAGDEVVLREIWRGRVWSGRPVTMVLDRPELVGLYIPAGASWMRPVTLDEGTMRLPKSDWKLVETRQTIDALRLTTPGADHSVLMLWPEGHGDLTCWYVNLEEPLRRTSAGFDYMDVVNETTQNNRWKKNAPGRGWEVPWYRLNLLLLRERNDTLTLDDPRPGFDELSLLVSAVVTKLYRNLRARFFSLALCRARERRLAIPLAKRARVILFVCKGNICRSPFADSYARKVFPASFTIESCGYYPIDNRPCPDRAVHAAEELGVDLGNHRSKLATGELLNKATLILTFDEEDRKTILDRFPGSRDKTFDLGVLAPDGDVWISDPYGGTVEGFHATYTTIKQTLDYCAANLSR